MESSFMVRILQSRDRDGLHLPGQAAGASAIIDLNVIRDTGRYGIHIDKGSDANIVGNVIENVPS